MAAWYTGLTVFALALAYRDRGLGRIPGIAIIAGYLAFMTSLLISVAQGKVSPAACCASRRRRGGCRCPAPDPVVALAAIQPHGDGQPGPRVAA